MDLKLAAHRNKGKGLILSLSPHASAYLKTSPFNGRGELKEP